MAFFTFCLDPGQIAGVTYAIHLYPRSPPRPSPGGLRYSDEDICNKYNGAVLTESMSLKEKSVGTSESEVSVRLHPPPS